MEVGPTAHYVMGGVRVNAETQETCVPGLFACGEVASGLHGANRLGGNYLSDLIVFVKRAGEFAAKKSKELEQPKINEKEIIKAAKKMLAPIMSENVENPGKIYDELREMMQNNVGIIRTENEMKFALEKSISCVYFWMSIPINFYFSEENACAKKTRFDTCSGTVDFFLLNKING